MSLLNDCEAHPWSESPGAPPLPGDGPIVYMQSVGPLLIIARHAEGELLCNVWSWFAYCDRWERCYLA